MSGWPDNRSASPLCRGCGRKAVYTTKQLCRRCYRRDKDGLEISKPIQVRRSSAEVRQRVWVGGREHKRCSLCLVWRPLSQFTSTPRAADGLYQYCKMCAAAGRHGLTRAQLEGLFEAQQGKCAICPKDITDSYVIDHDHRCCAGKLSCGQCVRGLLCPYCNVSLGRFGDNVDGLERAVRYLKSRRALVV